MLKLDFWRRSLTLMAALSTLTCSAFLLPPQPVRAQFGQGIFDQSVINSALRCVDALRSYYTVHKTLPQQISDQDQALNQIYQQAFGSPPDPSVQITTNGAYRVLGNLRLCTDQTIRNAPMAQWRKNPPDNWTAPANSIVILVDGGSQYLIWCAAINGVPMRDQNQNAILLSGDFNPPPPG